MFQQFPCQLSGLLPTVVLLSPVPLDQSRQNTLHFRRASVEVRSLGGGGLTQQAGKMGEPGCLSLPLCFGWGLCQNRHRKVCGPVQDGNAGLLFKTYKKCQADSRALTPLCSGVPLSVVFCVTAQITCQEAGFDPRQGLITSVIPICIW